MIESQLVDVLYVVRHTQSKTVSQMTGKIVDFVCWMGNAWKRICNFAWMERALACSLAWTLWFVFLEISSSEQLAK